MSRMMLLLIAHIIRHPVEVLCSETHNAVPSLPIEELSISQFMVDVMGTRTLQLSNPLGNHERWGHADDDMQVRFSSADFMEDHALRLQCVTTDVLVKQGFDLRAD